MIWRNPWAWAGLLFLALPVLIHLLSRAPADVRPFPSLRFVDPSRLSPRRRTRPRDVLLLLVRLGVVAAAVAALAGPVWMTPHRAGAPRVVRALVVDTSASMGRGRLLDSAGVLATATASGAALHTLVRTADLHAGIRGALAWLAEHPGMRELVVISDFQRGSVDPATLGAVPASYGMRVVQLRAGALPDSFTTSENGGSTGAVVRRARALADRTEMSWSRADAVPATFASAAPAFQLRVSPEERPGALAAYAAAMDAAGFPDAASATMANGADDTMPERIVLTARTFTPSDAAIQIVYPLRTMGGADDAPLDAAPTPLREAWMAGFVLRLARDPLLRDIARSHQGDGSDGSRRVVRDAGAGTGAGTGAARTAVESADTNRFTVVATPSGVPLVQAAQDSSRGIARLLLLCRADPGSPLSAALIAAVAKALPAGAGDSTATPTVGPVAMAMQEREPLMMPASELDRWNRAPGDSTVAAAAALSAADVEHGGVSDARWLWGFALLLLAIEGWLRRGGGTA